MRERTIEVEVRKNPAFGGWWPHLSEDYHYDEAFGPIRRVHRGNADVSDPTAEEVFRRMGLVDDEEPEAE